MKNKLLKILSLTLVMLVSVVGAFLIAPTNVTTANAEGNSNAVCKDESHIRTTLIENGNEPKCDTPGSYDQVVWCTVCDVEVSREKVELSALGHVYDFSVDGKEIVKPTCENTGVMEYVCTRDGCGEKYYITLAPTGHKPGQAVKEDEVKPTCDTNGAYDLVEYCTECKKEISRETVTIDALGHKSGTAVKENEVAATCIADGSYDEVVKCTVCNAEISRENIIIPKLGHDLKDEVTPATCTKPGYVKSTCERDGCNYSLKQLTDNALGHKPGDVVKENEVAATCIKDGGYYNVVYCTTCKAQLSREAIIVPMLGHKPGEVVFENIVYAECEKPGSYDRVTYCTVCEDKLTTETVETDALEHKYTSVVIAPTCEKDGYTTYSCSICKNTYEDNKVAALGHKPGEAVRENEKSATCTTNSSYEEVVCCDVCHKEISRETITRNDKLGHTEVIDEAKEPTCTTTGLTEGKHCSVCDEVLVAQEELPALGHNYDAVVTDPTCTEKGYTTHTCGACGYTYKENGDAALGHTNGEVVIENKKSSGIYDEVVYCTVCEKETSRTTIKNPGKIEKQIITESDITTALKQLEINGKKEVTISIKSNTDLLETTVRIPKFNAIADAGYSLVINTSVMSVTFDKEAVKKIQSSTNSTTDTSVSLVLELIELDTLDKTQKLNDTQQKAIKRRSTEMLFAMQVTLNNNVITDFGTGKAKVELPFEIAENREAEDYKIFYISDSGELQEVTPNYVNGKFVIELSHFSEYVVIDGYLENTRQAGAVTSLVILFLVAAIAGVMIYLRKAR